MKMPLLVCGVLLVSSACSHQPVSLQTVFSSNQCAFNKPVVRSIDTAAELDQFLQSMPGTFGQAKVPVPEIDFEQQSAILYALGQKPSSGYSIELYRTDAVLKEKKLYLPVRTQQPASGGMQAQVITSPCNIYVLPRTDYSDIVIDSPSAP